MPISFAYEPSYLQNPGAVQTHQVQWMPNEARTISHAQQPNGYVLLPEYGQSFMRGQSSNPANVANPLSYCIIPDYSTFFEHGPTLSSLLNKTSCFACQNFMAEYGSHHWDVFCETALQINRETQFANNAMLGNSQCNTLCNQYFGYKPTVGEMVLRNASERRFLHWKQLRSRYEPFDYTVSDSPLVAVYPIGELCLGRPSFRFLSNAAKVQEDLLVGKMLQYPITCFDVLLRIYEGVYLYADPDIDIKNTSLHTFFETNHPLFQRVHHYLASSIPTYSQTQVPTDDTVPLLPLYPPMFRAKGS